MGAKEKADAAFHGSTPDEERRRMERPSAVTTAEEDARKIADAARAIRKHTGLADA
jgi:hypothetical protein